MTGKDELDDIKTVAKESINVQADGRHAVASVPGQAGHHEPGSRAKVVDEVLDDPRVKERPHVTVVVPTGDAEALERVRERLDVTSTRPAGSTVIVDAEASDDGDAQLPGR